MPWLRSRTERSSGITTWALEWREGGRNGKVRARQLGAVTEKEAEFERIQKSKCTKIIVRRAVGQRDFLKAFTVCDVMIIGAHGKDSAPYLSWSGQGGTVSSPAKGAKTKSVVTAGCQMKKNEEKFKEWLNKNENSIGLSTPPASEYDAAGNITKVKGMEFRTAALKAMKAEDKLDESGACCETTTVCVLFASE